MRSEELAALAGDLEPVDLGPAHNHARDEVVRFGKATGKEHGVAVFEDGTTVSFGGEYENRLDVPEFDAPQGSVTIHHNHPSGDSFSRADIRLLLERRDIGRVDAHGHAGGWASCERVVGPASKIVSLTLIQDAASRANRLIEQAISRKRLEADAAEAGLWQVVMALILESEGVIRYALNSESVKEMARKILK